MSNFNFQWTKTLYWIILSHITFFCKLFKSHKYLLYVAGNNSKKKVLMGAQENKFQISQELRKQGKIVRHKISFCEIWSFWRLFSQAPIEIFSLELFHITKYTFIAYEKCLYNKECNDWNYSDTDFTHWN